MKNTKFKNKVNELIAHGYEVTIKDEGWRLVANAYRTIRKMHGCYITNDEETIWRQVIGYDDGTIEVF